MSAAQDQALAFLLSLHAKEALPEGSHEERTVGRNLHLLPKAEKPAAKVKARKPATLPNGQLNTPNNPKPLTSLSLVIPAVGTYDARSFMLAMRSAGLRPNDRGVMFRDALHVRNDEIKAIAGYCGYDSRLPHGQQDQASRAKAAREISGQPIVGMTRAEQRSAARSMTGYVAGCPDHVARQLSNLQARERETVSAMLDHNKAAKDASRDADARVLSMQLAAVEGERLISIRDQIDRLKGD